MIYKFFFKIIIIISIFLLPVSRSISNDKLQLPIWTKKTSSVLKRYYKVHRKLSKLSCSSGTEQMFERLLKKFRGNGYFVPLLPNEKLDKETLVKYLPIIKSKIDWIQSQKKNLRGMNNLISIKKSVVDLRLLLNILLKQKKILYLSKSKNKRLSADKKSIEFFEELRKKYNKLIIKTPFFLPYDYPVDYLKLRKQYDKHKISDDYTDIKKANAVYFYRKIVEDGAARRDHSGNDLFLRTTISTLSISFKQKNKYLTEQQRYDLEYVLKSMERYLIRGKKRLQKRFEEWEGRTKRIYQFYEGILSGKFKQKGKIIKTEEVVRLRSMARFKLKEFVQSKMVQVYKFMAKQTELIQALFAIETILYNEVGGMDGRDALERTDVAQVVINRFFMDEYAFLLGTDPMYKNLFLSLDKKIEKYRWLNVLFKQGEFSFTFYYMPESIRIFCPSMTRYSRKLRKQNLKIVLKKLKQTNNNFSASRYFSRASMLGRIDMSTLWHGYSSIPERPGKRIFRISKIKKKYRQNKFQFFYRFTDNMNKKYDVIEIADRKYVKEVGKLRFFKYRSPHMFKYFQKIIK